MGDQAVNGQPPTIEFEHGRKLAEVIVPGPERGDIAADKVGARGKLYGGLLAVEGHGAGGAHGGGEVCG